jgi:hypothetical protein
MFENFRNQLDSKNFARDAMFGSDDLSEASFAQEFNELVFLLDICPSGV